MIQIKAIHTAEFAVKLEHVSLKEVLIDKLDKLSNETGSEVQRAYYNAPTNCLYVKVTDENKDALEKMTQKFEDQIRWIDGCKLLP